MAVQIGVGTFKLDPNEVRQIKAGPNGPVVKLLERMGREVLNQAKANAPVDTGFLQGSLTQEDLVQGGEFTVRVAAVAEYARYVHDGTRRMPGRPFLKDALETVVSRGI